MTRNIILHTLQDHLYSLRFFTAMALVLIVYTVSTISFIKEYKDVKLSYERLAAEEDHKMKEQAEESATSLAIESKKYIFPPRNNSFMSVCSEDIIPNTINYTAYVVNGFERSMGKSNPFILPTKAMNWQFIITLLFSFLAIVFSYDTVSGEKETKTLALCMSNSISKGKFLWGKFIGVNLVLFCLILFGTLVSLIILAMSPVITINFSLFMEIFSFLILTIILIAVLTSLGILTSVLFSNPDISLLIGITVWMVFLFVIPNTALLVSNKLFPVEKAETIAENNRAKRDEIEAGYPEGKWSSRSNDPFYPRHEIRANMMMDFAENQEKIYHAWYNTQFYQYENTCKIAWLSPLSLFDYGTEHLLDGGYTRFIRNWNDINNYQETFLAFFKEFDANDDKSPHWYNPYERYSTTRKPVSYEEVPKYVEHATPVENRILKMAVYTGGLILYGLLFMTFAFMRFLKYDVR